MEEKYTIDFEQMIGNVKDVVDGSYDGGNWISGVLSPTQMDRLRALVREHSPDTITPDLVARYGLGSNQNEVARLLGRWKL